jgi:hypothetical protein
LRGNYWIIPTQTDSEKGWLVPNPTKGLSLDRMQSLSASFDRDIMSNASNTNCVLVAPALVQILPIVEPLTWKLVERGKLTNTQIPQSAVTTNVIEGLLAKLVKLNDRILQIEQGHVKSEDTEILSDRLVKLNDRILQIEQGHVKSENTEALANKQTQLQSIVSKIVEQLANKQQEIATLKSQLDESKDLSARFDRELTALKLQIGSNTNNQTANAPNAIDSTEITSLKIELEQLKSQCQQWQHQQDKTERELMNRVQQLVAQEIAKIQPVSTQQFVETLDAEIINSEPSQQPKSLPKQSTPQPSNDRVTLPFTNFYNSGEETFRKFYMFSTASVIKNDDRIVELAEDNIGHYWIVAFDNSTHYLVPKMDFPNHEKCLEILALLFDGANDRAKFTLFKPAIVTITKANMPKQWKLEQKGYLDPKLSIT